MKGTRFLRENSMLFDTRIDIPLKRSFFCFYRKHGSSFVKPVSLARELQFAHTKKWNRFCTWIQSNEEEGTTPKGRTCLGIYQDLYLLFLTAGVLFHVPFIFFKWKITLVPGLSHMIQKKFVAQIRTGFNTFLMLLQESIRVLYSCD